MNNGILLALLAYATYSWSDAAIKALGGELSIFEIGFFVALISGTCIVLTTPKDEHWLDFWRMKRPWGVQGRAISGVVASVFGVIAFTTIPLAEVYALVFLAPLFVTILSLIFLKEQVGPWRWFAVVAGFAGVMLVVQPGFRTLEPGHFAALAVAMLAAVSVILMRSLASHETRTTMLGYLIIYALLLNAVGMAFTGFTVPTLQQAGILLIAGVFSATGNIGLLRATRFAQANQLAPTHYSQIIWAVIIGALIFDEKPDLLSIAGLAIIAGSGLLTVVRERIRLGAVKWNPFGRNRL
ncbi:MAG: DMT family transporter [Alphaproteobacteria bacterium]|nr:DMT family transporter [Alphaproteobacteria bacterium]MBU0804695.1 DMT family transporter [Alphaproteobacteria bacterium]MBU0870080.1 DMT family transporter [Alphaproteobacteria bacterium]MBU1401107.1 DMT family transporter [Alphaproteobacteria bacterium]MBU1592476.1 DMT family transporter [Alphaproteobacteria bacterium]